MRLKLLTGVLVLSSTLLTACATVTSSNRVIVSSAEKWAILPITNLSKTPLAGNRASALVETHVRARGVKNLEVYQPPESESVIALLDSAGQLASAKNWARENGYRYGITGDVQEWSYKNGLDNEPSIGMTLKFVDLHSDEVMWTANATRTGWGYANLSSTANKTIDELLTQVSFKSNVVARPTLAAAAPPPLATAPQPLPAALPPAPSTSRLPYLDEVTPSAGTSNPSDSYSRAVTAPIRPLVIDQ